jgi:hypothetical protein
VAAPLFLKYEDPLPNNPMTNKECKELRTGGLERNPIYCSKCGAKFDFWDVQEEYNIHTTCGYGSRYDEDEIFLRLCCKCFDELVDGCKISPVIRKEVF